MNNQEKKDLLDAYNKMYDNFSLKRDAGLCKIYKVLGRQGTITNSQEWLVFFDMGDNNIERNRFHWSLDWLGDVERRKYLLTRIGELGRELESSESLSKIETTVKVEKTDVIFRYWKKDIIAIFPALLGDSYKSSCLSYMHTGQHSACHPQAIISNSKPATAEQYEGLLEELNKIGYDCNVVSRMGVKHQKARYEKHITRYDQYSIDALDKNK